METMQEIYNRMSKDNLIDNKEYLERLLDFYKTSSRPIGMLKGERNSDFYDFLTKNNKDYTDNSEVNQEDYKKFYIKMTNKWISNILSLNEQQLDQLSQNGLGGYYQIKQILQDKKQVSTMEEIKKIYDKMQQAIGDNFDLEEKRYFWRLLQNSNGFNPDCDYIGNFSHVDSRYGKARQENSENVDYRLYINCANKDIFKIVNTYVDYCEQNAIHYYFKYQADKNRQDKIIIYSSKEQLGNNIAILRQIAKDHPEILSNCGPKLDLTGNIDNWIGLASEPDKKVIIHKHSFNTLRAEILEDAAEQLTLNFIKLNRGHEDIQNELVNRAIDVIKKEMKNIPKEKFTQEYIDKLKKNLVTRPINSDIRPILSGFKRLEEVMPEKNNLFGTNNIAIFTIKQPDDKDFSYSIKVADKVLKSMVDVMKKKDPDYLEKYNKEIKRKCQQYAVDPKNFALNSNSLDDFKQIDSVETTLLLNSSNNFESYSNWDEKNLYYIRGILSTLPSEILMIKIPNSSFYPEYNLSLKQYVEEYLVSRMDKNQNFLTESGELIPVTDLIRNLVEQYYNQQEISNKHKRV